MHPSAKIAVDIEAISKIPMVSTLLEVIARTTGMGFTAIARVTDKHWVACAVNDEIGFGLKPGGELELETTICHEIRQSGQKVVIDHVSLNSQFNQHHTPKLYGFESYISVPITLANGEFFGTLCAIDPKPAKLDNPTIIGMFMLYADLIAMHLQSMSDVRNIQARLSEEQEISRIRDQFIAILGHDLRNPLTAIQNSATLLQRWLVEEDQIQLAGIIKNSSGRMSSLLEKTLDLAKGKLGGGLEITRQADKNIKDLLEDVVAEQLAASPQGSVTLETDLPEPVTYDLTRMSQLLANLLGNALKYGDHKQPILVKAASRHGIFQLSVSNSGQKISPAILTKIFEPFSRGEVHPGQQGLGLGLYIASEIARAHNGKLEVLSTDDETRFTLIMPSA